MNLSQKTLFALTALAAAGSALATPDGQGQASPGAGQTITGRSYSVYLTAPGTGERIALTVHEPTRFTGGQKYPLIMQGHGFSFSRSKTPDGTLGSLANIAPVGALAGNIRPLLDAGFGVISFDQRGHGESTATVTTMDPELDGKNLVQMVDWAEDNLDWLAYKDGNLRLGAVGGSYGGGFQLTLLALDPKKRLDAIVPQVTWNDLSYSLVPGNVPKSGYGAGLLAAGEFGTGFRMDQKYVTMILNAAATNVVSNADQQTLRYHSLKYFCDGVTQTGRLPATHPPRVDALFMQGNYDALFDVNEAYANYKCLSESGGDVRLYTYPAGHILPSSPGLIFPAPNATAGLFSCGSKSASAMEVGFLRAKLKDEPDAFASQPKVCLSLDSAGDAIAQTDVKVGGSAYNLPPMLVGANLLGAVPAVINLYKPGTTTVLAGIPTATLTLADPILGVYGIGDPIVFVALGKNGLPLNDQIMPIRGYGTHQINLKAVAKRLAAGEQLQLLYYGTHYQYFEAGSRFSPPLVKVTGQVRLPLLGNVPSL